MDAQRAAGTPISIDVAGKRRTFNRLSRRDVCTLMASMPEQFPSVFEFYRWSSTPEGAVAVLACSSGETPEAVERWGSLVDQVTWASLVVAESITTGDEPPAPEGKKCSDPRDATTQPRPSPSPGNAPALATRGD